MASGLTLQVRQIGSYAAAGAAGPGDLMLMQPGGLGNPYATIDAAKLVASALADAGGPLVVGVGAPPLGATTAAVCAGEFLVPVGSGMVFGAPPTESFTYQTTGYLWTIGGLNSMTLNNAGALSLPYGTLTVARDPAGALEVATMVWVGANTVGSFSGRRGAVTLNGGDIYGALCLDSAIAT